MTLRKSPVVILSEAKNLNSLRTHRELLHSMTFEVLGWRLEAVDFFRFSLSPLTSDLYPLLCRTEVDKV